jgi:hypothetical protein
MWTLSVTSAIASGTYSFVLEASDLSTGPFTTIATFAWPAGAPKQEVWIGINAGMARTALLTSRVRYARVRALVSGVTPSLAFSSWLSKPGGGIGLGARARDSLSTPAVLPLTETARTRARRHA